MLKQIRCFFEDIRYGRLDNGHDYFDIYYKFEHNFINSVHVIDCDHMPDISAKRLSELTRPIQWKLASGSPVEVHMLSILLTDRVDEISEILQDNMFCWFIDTSEQKLIVPEGKAEDYYGLRQKLMDFLAIPFDEEAYNCRIAGQEIVQERENGKSVSFAKWFFGGAVINHIMVVINIIVFLAGIFAGDRFYEEGARIYEAIIDNGQWYRILTSMFLHADSYHLFSNMIWLFLLGDIVERMSGRWKYLVMYLVSGICGGLLSMYMEYINQSFAASVGASGAVFGIEGALLWIIIRNHGRVENMTVPKILFSVGISMYYGLASTNIDNAAHLGGFIGGILLAIVLYRKKDVTDQKGIVHED